MRERLAERGLAYVDQDPGNAAADDVPGGAA